MKTPLRISIQILSPIELPKYPIHLDSLLYWAIKENSTMPDEEVLSLLDTILEKQNGIYKASSIRYIRNADIPLTRTMIAHPTRTHWEDWPFTVIEKRKNIIVKGGPFRKRMTKKNGLYVGAVEFFAIGHAEKIHYLLDSLGFIGTSNRQGFGEMGEITIQKISEDFSYFDECGNLARILPVSMLKNVDRYLKMNTSVKPPYQTSKRHYCAIPDFRVITKQG